MADPVDLLIQQALVVAGRAAPELQALQVQRVFDRPPDNPTHPYTRIRIAQDLDVSNSCSAATEVFAEIHVWSEDVGSVECRRIVGAWKDLLEADLSVAGHIITVQERVNSVYLDDEDGVKTHAVMTYKFHTDPTA